MDNQEDIKFRGMVILKKKITLQIKNVKELKLHFSILNELSALLFHDLKILEVNFVTNTISS